MKKLILLALVALVAGAAFAETAPAFSGSFEYNTQLDFNDDTYKAAASPDASINLNGVVDEWSTVNAEIKGTTIKEANAYTGGFIDKGVADLIEIDDTLKGTGSDVKVKAGHPWLLTAFSAHDAGDPLPSNDGEIAIDERKGVLKASQFALTTNVTGALGVDGPVDFTIKWGEVTFKADDYSGKAGFEDLDVVEETDSYVGTELTFTVADKVKLIVSLAPSTYLGSAWGNTKEAVMGFEAQFMFVEGLDLNAWYMVDQNKGETYDGFNQIGATLGYDMGNISAGVIFVTDLDADQSGLGVSLQYAMDVLKIGLAFGGDDFGDFAGSFGINVNTTFKVVPDVLDLFAAVKIPFQEIGDNLGLEAGVDFFLGATTYTLGYEMNKVNFKSPANTFDDDSAVDGLFFKVKASF